MRIAAIVPFILILILSSTIGYAQHRNDNWVFGDSAGVNFSNLSNPIPIHSAAKSRGSAACISDTSGNILFYYSYDPNIVWGTGNPDYNGNVYNKEHQIMQNGDGIVTGAWYQEGTIVPNPSDTNLFYLFTVGVSGAYGLYYSSIDMALDSGRGAVVQKNVQLLSYPADDGLIAVKHGNGRDWWIIFRKNGLFAGWYTNRFYKYLVAPSGINLVDSQGIGSNDVSNTLRYVFNKTGNKLAMVSYEGIIETFDFDRCSGLLSNHTLIRNGNTTAPWPEMTGCAFSSNGRYLYISTNGFYDSTFVIQVDLQNTLLYAAADTVGTISYPNEAGGFLERGPNDKIYFSSMWNDGITFGYPYPDSVFNQYNTYLSVITQPDSLGIACSFAPYSFYLGGNRTYWGLPNNPDYDLPRIIGSPCDTVWSGIQSPSAPKGGVLNVTYISAWDKLFVNGSGLKGKSVSLVVYDVLGKVVYQFNKLNDTGSPLGAGGYFTQDVNCSQFAKGMYIVSLQTEKERLSKKFIKE